MSDLKIDRDQLVVQFGEKISRLSHRMIWNKDLAREATQEVWYELFKSLDSFRASSSLSTWIYTIAQRTISRYAKNEINFKAEDIDNHFNLDHIDYSGEESDRKEWVKELDITD